MRAMSLLIERVMTSAVPPGAAIRRLLVVVFLAAALLMAVAVQSARAQAFDEEQEIARLIQRIQEDLELIDENLLEAEKARGVKGSSDRRMDTIIEDTMRKHEAVIEGIEELIRSIKYSSSSSGGSSTNPPPDQQQQNQDQSQQRREGSTDDELKENPNKPDESDGSSKDGDPSNDKGRQEQADRPKSDPPSKKEDHSDTSGRWGLLPPKVQEEILNSNVDDFPQKYRKWLEEYYRRVGRKR